MEEQEKAVTLKETLAAARQLDDTDQKRLLNALRSTLFPNTYTEENFAERLREKRFHKGFICSHCQGEDVIRHGTHKRHQRYRCKTCNKTFCDITHTPLRGTHHPEKWLGYLECMIKGYSLRKCAEILEISISTSFFWRHKVLNALKRLPKEAFKGILEADETYFRLSEKGNKNIVGRKPRKRGEPSNFRGLSREQVCVLVARDRTKQTHSQVACLGQISKKTAKELLNDHIKGVSYLCTDANGTWRAFAKEMGLDHVELNSSKKELVKRKIYHVQNVNGLHSRLKKWMDRFNGVASKFLDNYLAWFLFVDARATEAVTAQRNDLILSAFMTTSPETYRHIRKTEPLPVY